MKAPQQVLGAPSLARRILPASTTRGSASGAWSGRHHIDALLGVEALDARSGDAALLEKGQLLGIGIPPRPDEP